MPFEVVRTAWTSHFSMWFSLYQVTASFKHYALFALQPPCPTPSVPVTAHCRAGQIAKGCAENVLFVEACALP